MPHQLRSAEFPSGFPTLQGRDILACAQGNLLSRRSASLISLAAACNLLGWEENPANSFLFQLHGRGERGKLAAFTPHFFEQCAFGSPWRKRTRIDSGHFQLPMLQPSCSDRFCAHTGRKHQVLSGLVKNAFVSTQAAAYSRSLCSYLAESLHAALDRQSAAAMLVEVSSVRVSASPVHAWIWAMWLWVFWSAFVEKAGA